MLAEARDLLPVHLLGGVVAVLLADADAKPGASLRHLGGGIDGAHVAGERRHATQEHGSGDAKDYAGEDGRTHG